MMTRIIGLALDDMDEPLLHQRPSEEGIVRLLRDYTAGFSLRHDFTSNWPGTMTYTN